MTDMISPLYRIDGACFAVGGRTLLHSLSLDLPARQVCGLIGLNGSGKSTLLKLLARQHAPTGGGISLDGVPLRQWNDRAYARKIGYLPQVIPPVGGMTVEELVALGRYPWHGALGRFRPGDRAKVKEALELTGMTGFAHRAADELSGGERQRAWLAMLVAQDTQCLLLDEPISALDVAHQVEVLSLVAELSRRRGLSVVMVLHDINMAARFCTRLFALRGGRLLFNGRPDELMRSDVLEKIYGIKMTVVPHPLTNAPIGLVQ